MLVGVHEAGQQDRIAERREACAGEARAHVIGRAERHDAARVHRHGPGAQRSALRSRDHAIGCQKLHGQNNRFGNQSTSPGQKISRMVKASISSTKGREPQITSMIDPVPRTP